MTGCSGLTALTENAAMRSCPRAPPPTIVGVQLRPLREAVPRARVQHHESLAGGGEVEERLAIVGRVEELPVDADDGDVGVADLGRGLIAILGVVDAEAGGAQRRTVGRRRRTARSCASCRRR